DEDSFTPGSCRPGALGLPVPTDSAGWYMLVNINGTWRYVMKYGEVNDEGPAYTVVGDQFALGPSVPLNGGAFPVQPVVTDARDLRLQVAAFEDDSLVEDPFTGGGKSLTSNPEGQDLFGLPDYSLQTLSQQSTVLLDPHGDWRLH